ncbi:MAG: glycosyltransferase family 2 protein [Candidatus Daviesbacteria bacterium]|nr:glycosyltransferase family 2 protein [Candidatus Daviesbacteria bacterium]
MVKTIGIIMTYNCAQMIKDTFDNLPKKEFDQIIVVDDGSQDKSVSVAKKLGILVFSHSHGGYGANIKFGLTKAISLGANYMVEIHGDGQYNPSVIPQALKKMKVGRYDLLLGSRFIYPKTALEDGMSIPRFLANIIFSFIDRHLFQIPLSEFYNGFRIYSKKLISKVKFENTANNYFYSFQVIIQAKYHNLKIGEIAVHCDYHKQHTSESFWAAALHSIETFKLFAIYLLAKLGFKTNLF